MRTSALVGVQQYPHWLSKRPGRAHCRLQNFRGKDTGHGQAGPGSSIALMGRRRMSENETVRPVQAYTRGESPPYTVTRTRFEGGYIVVWSLRCISRKKWTDARWQILLSRKYNE
ncbi:hypothetical protein PMIN03_004808 [Paraphaeosphaeria minitans]